MNFWIGVVFFCVSPDACYFFKPHQTFSEPKNCYKVVNEFAQKAEDAGAILVRSNCMYIEAGKTTNGKESLSKS